ncbi:unnamed protein product [Caenorhabditis nigoni]
MELNEGVRAWTVSEIAQNRNDRQCRFKLWKLQEEIENRAVKETAQSDSGRATVSTQITRRRMGRQNLCKNYCEDEQTNLEEPNPDQTKTHDGRTIRFKPTNETESIPPGASSTSIFFRNKDLSYIIMEDLEGRLLERMQTSNLIDPIDAGRSTTRTIRLKHRPKQNYRSSAEPGVNSIPSSFLEKE